MSSEITAKPIITKNSSEFKLDEYASIPAGELVVFAVQVLQADSAPVAVEEVVSTCFRLFPHSFALKNYFYWPDSALVSRRLHDAKEKGLLKGNATDGYETKVPGRQVARHVAKTLGVLLPTPPKVETPVVEAPPVKETVTEKKEEEKKDAATSAPVVKAVKKKSQTKAAKKPTVKKQPAKQKSQPKLKKKAIKTTEPVKKKTAIKPKVQPKKVAAKTKVKQKRTKSVPKPKVQPKPVVKVEKKVTVKAAPKAKIEKPKAKKAASPQPKQLTMALPPVAAKKKVEAPAAKPKVKKEAQAVKGEVLAPVAVSKEEKDKAAKVVKQIERSDAYQLYRRSGKRAQIGEFDFRNMLFATMESSADTLKRNVDLFKRYAGIHFRTDLVAFLEFCEESFSALLISKAKVKGKR